MNNKILHSEYEFSVTHPKYRAQCQDTDCYKIIKNLTRILQLPTIAKITTDNESIAKDFLLKDNEYGLEPYNEYAIKLDDTYGTSLYILVHKKIGVTYICPIIVCSEDSGSCFVVEFTDNWRTREMKAFVKLEKAENEFGLAGLMLAVDTRNGVYGYLSFLNEPKKFA